MQIIQKKIKDIHPYEKNPRVISDEAIEKVANSIKEFGFKVPIVIDKDGTVVTGHTRLKAAEKLGMTEVPCIVADDLTPEQIKAFRLADNKVSEFSEWNLDLLNSEIEILDIDMEQFGFDPNASEIESGSEEYKEEELNFKCEIIVECDNESQQEKIFKELQEKGYVCHISA